MKKLLICIFIIFQLFMLTGCWGARIVQGETLVTGIGIDFNNGEFIVYIQALNFSNIAKQEGGATLQESPPVLIGQASGNSIASAINSLEQKAALPLYFGHVFSIILSKNVIDQELNAVNDFISSRSLLRYNTWLFGTQEDIKGLFTSESFFNLPAGYTIIDTPQLKTRKNFMLPNLMYHKYISRYSQPVGSILIPSISINKENFEEKEKKNLAVYNGAFVISQKQSRGFIKLEELKGLQWLNQVNYTIPVNLTDQKVSVQVKSTKSQVDLIKGKKPVYKIKIIANATLSENENGLKKKKIIKSLKKLIKSELVTAIKKGDELNVDLLNISEKPYRFSSKWDTKTINEINENSIKEIDVNVHIVQSQTFK